MTGFSARVRLLVRSRAGGGQIEDACCESCGIWCGRYGGQIQHRLARGIGGSPSSMTRNIVNAALLCGTPFSGCHGKAEARDPEMEDRGFVIRHGVGPEFDPRFVPLVLLGGVEVWLSEDGRYLYEPPAEAAA